MMRERSEPEVTQRSDEPPSTPGGLRVLCRVTDSDTVADLCLLLGRQGSVVYVRDIEVPDQTPLSFSEGLLWDPHTVEGELEGLAEQARQAGIEAEPVVHVTHDATNGLVTAAEANGVGLIVLEPRPDARLSRPVDPDAIAKRTGTPVLEVHARQPGFAPRSILVPIDTGAHGATALRLASLLASRSGAALEVLHVVDEDASPERIQQWEQRLASQLAFFAEGVQATVRVEPAEDIAAAVLDRSHDHDVLVLGATRRGWFSRHLRSTIPEAVREHADIDVLVVHAD